MALRKIPEPPVPPSTLRAKTKPKKSYFLLDSSKKEKTKKQQKKTSVKKIQKAKSKKSNKKSFSIFKKTKQGSGNKLKEQDKQISFAKNRIERLEYRLNDVDKSIKEINESLAPLSKLGSKLSDVRSLFLRIRDLERMSARYEKDESEIQARIDAFQKKLKLPGQIEHKLKLLSGTEKEIKEISELSVQFDERLKKLDYEMELFFKGLRDNGKRVLEIEERLDNLGAPKSSELREEIDEIKKNLFLLAKKIRVIDNRVEKVQNEERTVVIE